MTVTVTLEELRDYERRMSEWHGKRFSIMVRAVESGTSFYQGKEETIRAVKHALDGFTEPAPKISDKL